MNDDDKKCSKCLYLRIQETGYSNWTVEGADAECLLNLNPGLPIDYWYGKAEQLDYAKKCLSFHEGEPVTFTVEGEIE